jgi:hypothetical protein
MALVGQGTDQRFGHGGDDVGFRAHRWRGNAA